MMIVFSGRRVHRSGLLVGSLVALTLSSLGGCGAPDREADADLPLPLSSLTAPLRDAVVWQQQALRTPVESAGAADVRLFYDLRQDLRTPTLRAAAADSLWKRWEAEPGSLLWIEVAILRARYLEDFDRLDQMLDLAAGADSTGPVARFIEGRMGLGRDPAAGRCFVDAATRAQELDPLQRAWLESRLALVESLDGDNRAAIARLLRTLPEAWQVGGLPLAACWWHDLSKYSRLDGGLDDALGAAGMAVACARRDGNEIQEIRGRLSLGQIHTARAEYGDAAAMFAAVEAQARAGGRRRWVMDAARLQADVNIARGDRGTAINQYRMLRDLALADADTQGSVAYSLSVANAFRYLGDLDSSRVWLERAERLDTVGTQFGNSGSIGALWLRYFLQAGDFVRADSVRAVVAEQLPIRGQRQILFDLVEQGLDSGRPDLAYRGLDQARRTPGLLVRDGAYDPALDLAHLAARFHARQGEFGLAHQQLQDAAGRVATGATLHARWDNASCRGQVGELAGDAEGARLAYELALDLADELEDPNLIQRSRIHLGEVLIQLGRPDDARRLFGDVLNVSDYWSRFSAMLLFGCAEAADGRHETALTHFAAADSLLRPDAPLDLRARLLLEEARSLAALGDAARAWGRLEQIDLGSESATSVRSTEVHRAFHRPLHRELAEVEIGLLVDNPGIVGRGDLALETLALAEQARWRVDPGGPEPSARTLAGLEIIPGSPVLAWFLGAERVFRWLGTSEGWTVLEIPDRGNLLEQIDAVQIDLESPERPVDEGGLRRLARRLLGPIEDHWSTGQELILVAPGRLADLAWPALMLEDSIPLIDHGAILHLANLSTLKNSAPSRETRPLLALGVDSPGDLANLRHAEAEARSVAAIWPDPTNEVRVGQDAGWSSIQALDLSTFAVIHLASHAVVSEGLPGCSTLRLAGIAGDHPVTVQEARALQLNAELVFLSCCEGARMGQDTGTGLDSFARAFLQAGAASVVASTRQVDDEASQTLALSFYRNWLSGKSRAASLQAAQQEVRDAGPRWRHPFYWAFYQVHRATGGTD